MTSLGFMGRVHWTFLAKVRLVISNLKSGVLVHPVGALSKEHVRHTGAGRQGRLLITKAVGKSYQEVTRARDSAGCSLGRVLVREG